SNLPRNLPVKRYDGDPLGRADVQHGLLCYLFSDTRRVFTNPRPLNKAEGASSSSGTTGVVTPVWPYGQSQGCLRRSDETEEEFQQWKETKERYDRWRKRMDRKQRRERKAAVAASKAAYAAAAAAAADKEPDADSTDPNANEERDELADGPGDGEADKDVNGADGAAAEDDDDDEDDDDAEPLDEDEFAKAGAPRLTFKELYIEALINSGKCTKSMRDKILADEEYAEDFAKVCLLVNVGRINTTLAFYPEMKTVLRSYHPLPSMQNNENTRRNMQDAPRMKSLLKAVLLDTERPAPPTAGPSAGQTPKGKPNALSEEAPSDFKEVIKRYRAGTMPPTSVVTLIFLLSLHASEVTDMHFPAPHDSHSLFYPHADYPLPSRQRAEAFLWLLYHYLEGPATKPPGELPNPFDDETSLAASREAREAYDNLAEDDRQKRANQPWKGLVNPEWQRWKKIEDKQRAEADEAAIKAATGSKPTDGIGVKKEGGEDGDALMQDGEKDAADAEKPAEEEFGPEPPSHTHRLLLPTLTVIDSAASFKENEDSAEEIRWGKQMQAERAAFLAKFQEEEVNKGGAAGSPAPSAGTASGRGGRKSGAGGAFKRDDASDGDASFAGGRGKKRGGITIGGSGADSKRSRMASPISFDDSVDNARAQSRDVDPLSLSTDPYLNLSIDSKTRIRPSLWDLDLTYPDPSLEHPRESLTQIAWSRILDRAQRGVGDACYESDEDDFAEEEALEESRSRPEVCRIIDSIRDVIRHDVFEDDNQKLRDRVAGAGADS
ncbi:hypothetical protein BCV70DRAFT_148936, partial [Testicularia cyperi]